jgi:hypothetical protein
MAITQAGRDQRAAIDRLNEAARVAAVRAAREAKAEAKQNGKA